MKTLRLAAALLLAGAVLQISAHAAPQAVPYLGRFTGDETGPGGRKTINFVIREGGDAIVRTSFEGKRDTIVENARWTALRAPNRFEVQTEKGARYEVEYLRGDTLRVTPVDPATGRRLAPFTAFKVQVDQFLGRFVGTKRGAGGPIEVLFNIMSEDDVTVRLTYNRPGSQPITEQGRLEGAGKAGRVRVLTDRSEYILERRSTDSLTVTEIENGRRLASYVVTRQDQQAWEGVFVWGAGASSFRPCREKAWYEVRGDRAVTDQLEREYRRVAKRPYEPVYVRLRGGLEPSARAGADYDGVFAAVRLDELRARRPGDCADASNPAFVGGTVTYRERIAVPRGAVVTVRLVDKSREDAVVAEQVVRNVTSVPVRFNLRYDPLDINERHAYAVRAELSVGGRVIFYSDDYPVVTNGNPRAVEVVLKAAPGR